MLLLINVLLTLWFYTAHGQGKPCNYPVIKHGRLYNSYSGYFPADVNQQFFYYCDQYFVSPSQRSWDYLTCTTEGWSPEEPCLRQCIFNYLENGHTPHREEKYLQGETVRVHCYEGYSLQNNQNTMTCTESGWSPPPRCIRVKTCSKYNITIENGFLSESTSMYPLNKQTEYKCKSGYVTADGKTSGLITCLQNGWSSQPVCINSQGKCGPPPPIDNGDITSLLQSVYPPGMSVEYQCQACYELQGNRNLVCQNGEWSEPPKCLEACVISEETMRKHHIELRWKPDTKLYFKTEDNIEFMCQHGYHPVTPQHTFRTTCLEGKVVYPSCGKNID
ncbi:complement factor H-related protein 3-like [Bos indicus]|uniref:Complement factor H-related protein 3-like n=1 Tax=Bos indicus TaxID=9915 RepID=A0ABM4QNU2_BOSIN